MILSIDPGSTESGWCMMADDLFPAMKGKEQNSDVLSRVYRLDKETDELVIEMVASYGMPVGADVFETCVWIGRFEEAAKRCCVPCTRIKRIQVKSAICHNSRANDATIKQALIDRFAPGVSNYGKGSKKDPGWFYGFRADIWQAYALGVAYLDLELNKNW